MSRNIYLIWYYINFENGPEDQLYTSVILLHSSGNGGGEDKFCNRTLQIPQHNTDMYNKKLILHNSISSAFDRSNPKQAPYGNQ
jgi:hypothetical protein